MITMIILVYNIRKMRKEQEDSNQNNKEIELTDIKQKQVGTEVFDKNLPSDLNFEGDSIPKDFQITPARPKLMERQAKPIKTDLYIIKQYTIRGKASLPKNIQYPIGSLIKQTIPTYQVKAYSQQSSDGILKNLWQKILGYTTRQLYIKDGFLYLLQETKQGLFVHNAWPFDQIFKIFPDSQENMIRFVVKSGQVLIPKDFQVQSVATIIEKIFEVANEVGIRIQ